MRTFAGPKHIAIPVLAKITGRSIEVLQRRLSIYASASEAYIPLNIAVSFVLGLADKSGKVTPKNCKFRLTLLDRLTVRQMAKQYTIAEELLYRKIAAFGLAQIQGTNILDINRPVPRGGKSQRRLNHFSVHQWMALQLVAHSTNCNTSDVMAWCIHLYEANQERLKR